MKKTLKVVGYLEALSIVALFGVAMPLKYGFGMPSATQLPGLIHGMLFMTYVCVASVVAFQDGWSRSQLWSAYVASVVPFGTLAFDRKFLR